MNSKGLLFLFALIVVTVFLFGSVAHSEDVAALNAMIHARGARWVAGETSMSRLSPAQRASRLGLLRHSSAPAGQVLAAPALGVNLPTSLDWRNYNGASYVTSIKDQGGCGACWAFATTGATESNTLVVNGTPNTDLDLSEQVLISCGGAGGCAGGYIDEASNYIRHTGLPLKNPVTRTPEMTAPARTPVPGIRRLPIRSRAGAGWSRMVPPPPPLHSKTQSIPTDHSPLPWQFTPIFTTT